MCAERGAPSRLRRFGEASPKGIPELLDRPDLERPVGELLLLGLVEQVQEGRYLRLGSHGPSAGPPPIALLEPDELGAISLGQRGLVLREQARELELELVHPVGHLGYFIR